MTTPRRHRAQLMAVAASRLLDALDEDQRRVIEKPFDDIDERQRWFYTPTDHGGLALSAMKPAQQRLAHQLVASGLSRAGYVTVATVIGLENVLDELEGWTATWGRERGRDPGLYCVSIFGDPSADDPWSWRFGGHHVSLHYAIVDKEVVGSTPQFIGADPANSPLLGGHLLRPLAALEDLGRELVQSLDADQRAAAVLSPIAPVDLVSANRGVFAHEQGDLPLPLADLWRGRFGGELGQRVLDIQIAAEQTAGITPAHLEAVRLTATPRGLAGRHLSTHQRELLSALLDTALERVPDDLAQQERELFSTPEGLDDVHFAWAGGLQPGEGHYYRLQNSDILSEYDNTQRNANHIHSVWRSRLTDFGRDPLAEHYRRHRHGSTGGHHQ